MGVRTLSPLHRPHPSAGAGRDEDTEPPGTVQGPVALSKGIFGGGWGCAEQCGENALRLRP